MAEGPGAHRPIAVWWVSWDMKNKTEASTSGTELDGSLEVDADLAESPWEVVSSCEGVGTPSLDARLCHCVNSFFFF